MTKRRIGAAAPRRAAKLPSRACPSLQVGGPPLPACVPCAQQSVAAAGRRHYFSRASHSTGTSGSGVGASRLSRALRAAAVHASHGDLGVGSLLCSFYSLQLCSQYIGVRRRWLPCCWLLLLAVFSTPWIDPGNPWPDLGPFPGPFLFRLYVSTPAILNLRTIPKPSKAQQPRTSQAS